MERECPGEVGGSGLECGERECLGEVGGSGLVGRSEKVWTRVPGRSGRVYSQVSRGRRESGVSRSVAYFYKGVLCIIREYLYFRAIKP